LLKFFFSSSSFSLIFLQTQNWVIYKLLGLAFVCVKFETLFLFGMIFLLVKNPSKIALKNYGCCLFFFFNSMPF
jgi:hypothetical protein